MLQNNGNGTVFMNMNLLGLKIFTDEYNSEKSQALSKRLGISVVNEKSTDGLYLQFSNGALSLTDNKMALCGDFSKLISRIRPNNLNGEMIVKAVRIKNAQAPLRIVDATAGLGEDSFLLAAAGFFVDMYEYNTVIALLLEDALHRAKESEQLGKIAERMSLFNENSINALKRLDSSPDVIVLDPMFPERSKQNTLIKKKFQLLQRLESPCDDEIALLSAAMAANPKKIVIKRPAKGQFLAGIKPDYSVTGKAIRYDCITNFKAPM